VESKIIFTFATEKYNSINPNSYEKK
jgi:hypothetical protein